MGDLLSIGVQIDEVGRMRAYLTDQHSERMTLILHGEYSLKVMCLVEQNYRWEKKTFVPEAEGRPAVQQHTAIETVLNMTPENKEHFQSEKEAIFLLLTGIGDEIYSTVDACNTANEM
ncbi:hypothetical protein Tco_0162584 [Tanacetum coccineum]